MSHKRKLTAGWLTAIGLITIFLLVHIQSDPYLWKTLPFARLLTMGILISQEKSLTAMTQEEVTALIGEPNRRECENLLWTYRTPGLDGLGCIQLFFDKESHTVTALRYDESCS